MSDLFSRIAASHLGLSAEVRPALRPSLAPRTPAVGTFPIRSFEEDDGTMSTLQNGPSDLSRTSRVGNAACVTELPAHAPGNERLSSPRPADVGQTRSAELTLPPSIESGASGAVPHRLAEGIQGESTVHSDVLRRPTLPVSREALESPRQSGDGASRREKTWPPNQRAHTSDQTAPLVSAHRMDVLVAQSASTRTPSAPVVHVHIDRVEVRAPAASHRAAPPTRGRPSSAGSLSDYLRGGKR